MDPETQRLRDELLYSEVKGGRTLYLVLAIVLGIATIAAVAMVFAVVSTNRGVEPLVTVAVMALAVGGMAISSWNEFKRHDGALKEIGSDPTGIDTCKTYSPATAKIIAQSRKDKKTLRQLLIAYGLMAVMFLGFGILMLVCLGLPQFQGKDNGLLVGMGALFFVLGAFLLMLTVKAFRQWRTVCKLEELG